MNKMSWPTFLFWNALGGIVWAAGVGLRGLRAGGRGGEDHLRGRAGRRGRDRGGDRRLRGLAAAGAQAVPCPAVRAALLAVLSLLLLPGARLGGDGGQRARRLRAGPARYDRVSYERFGPASAKRVLILVPGTQGGAGDFSSSGRRSSSA